LIGRIPAPPWKMPIPAALLSLFPDSEGCPLTGQYPRLFCFPPPLSGHQDHKLSSSSIPCSDPYSQIAFFFVVGRPSFSLLICGTNPFSPSFSRWTLLLLSVLTFVLGTPIGFLRFFSTRTSFGVRDGRERSPSFSCVMNLFVFFLVPLPSFSSPFLFPLNFTSHFLGLRISCLSSLDCRRESLSLLGRFLMLSRPLLWAALEWGAFLLLSTRLGGVWLVVSFLTNSQTSLTEIVSAKNGPPFS